LAFGTHIFISYAHFDNDETTGSWVSQFHELLEAYLRASLRRIKPVIWRDKRLSDNEVFDNTIIEKLTDSAIMIAVVSDNYVASDWCIREANTFCDEAERTVGLAPKNLSRVFKIIKRPPETEQPLPEPMKQVVGSQFFMRVDKNDQVSDDENDAPVELDLALGDVFAQKLRLRVNRLAQDIGNTLKAVDEVASAGAEADAPANPPSTKEIIYLAECGDDRHEDHASLRSELIQRGYHVVPTGALPPDEAQSRAEIARLMKDASTVIHLIGARSGTVPGGEGAASIIEIQNDVALDVAKEKPLNRVVSLPAGTYETALGDRYRQFVQDIQVNSDVQGKCELITGGLEQVKAAMLTALESKKTQPLSAAGQAESAIYVVYERSDLADSKPLRRALQEFGTVLKPAFVGEPSEVREANLKNLATCDAVVIFYGSGSEGWKAAVDGDILRARALRDGRPFKSVLTVLSGEMTEDKEDLVGDPDVIDAMPDFSDDMLQPLRDKLTDTSC